MRTMHIELIPRNYVDTLTRESLVAPEANINIDYDGEIARVRIAPQNVNSFEFTALQKNFVAAYCMYRDIMQSSDEAENQRFGSWMQCWLDEIVDAAWDIDYDMRDEPGYTPHPCYNCALWDNCPSTCKYNQTYEF